MKEQRLLINFTLKFGLKFNQKLLKNGFNESRKTTTLFVYKKSSSYFYEQGCVWKINLNYRKYCIE